jgi:hypothetical protein
VYKETSILPQGSNKNSKNKNSDKNTRNKNHARLRRKQNQVRNPEKQESDKKAKIQKSWLAIHFSPHQTRFGLHESCQKEKICFFRQDSYLEGMAKESWLILRKARIRDGRCQ